MRDFFLAVCETCWDYPTDKRILPVASADKNETDMVKTSLKFQPSNIPVAATIIGKGCGFIWQALLALLHYNDKTAHKAAEIGQTTSAFIGLCDVTSSLCFICDLSYNIYAMAA